MREGRGTDADSSVAVVTDPVLVVRAGTATGDEGKRRESEDAGSLPRLVGIGSDTKALLWNRLQGNRVEPTTHPLMHEDFSVQSRPTGVWVKGWQYHTHVMEYLFTTEIERKWAIRRLLEAGFGENGMNYIYVDGDKASVNGEIFPDIASALKYMEERKLGEVMYTSSAERFPRKVPENIKADGVEIWLRDWRK
jgi:hypothetical protein